MQNKYSLANAMAKDGRDVFGSADGANDAGIVNPGSLWPEIPVDAAMLAPLSGMVLALTNADLKLNELAQSLGVLRENVDSLEVSLSSLKAADAHPLKTQAHTETKRVSEFTSTKSEDLRQTREAMMAGTGQILDPVAVLRYSNANRSFDTTATSEKSITVLREVSTESENRLSKTLEPAPILLEESWLKLKTGVMDGANDLSSDSPAAASAVKTAEAVIMPMVSGFVSGLGETIKTRVAGNVVDVTLGKLPGIGKLFQDGGYRKDKDKEKQCCAPATLSLDTLGALEKATAQTSESVGKTEPEKGKASPSGKVKRRRVKSSNSGQTPPTAGKAKVVAQTNVTPKLNAKDQPLAPSSINQPNQAPITRLGNSFASYAAPSANRPMVRGASKGLAASLSGAFAKLESFGARRLGPLKYADTAVDLIQGVRNGDAKAIGTGLSTAGGAWAGASAGAALGTLVFPGIGTAVGGAIGGLLGSEAGSWLGDKLFGASDRLPAPNTVSKELNSARTDSVQVTIAPSIQITGVNPADAQQVVNQVIQALQFQCMPMVTDSLGIRRNAALADPGGD